METCAPDAQPLPLEVSLDLVQPREAKAATTTSLSLDGLLNPPVLLHEDLANGNGGQVWPAGVALAAYLLRVQADALLGKSILELGAGGGIVSLALAQWLRQQPGGARGTTIAMTDQAPMVPLMRRNLAINGFGDDLITAGVLDWGATPWGRGCDVLLAADCVYFEPAFPLLLQTMRELVGPGTVCYFCMKKRRKADHRFIKELRKAFCLQDVLDDPARPVWSREAILMYVVTARRTGSKVAPAVREENGTDV